jgi:hypothetical protein
MTVHIVAGYWNLDLRSGELILCPRSREMFGFERRSPKRLRKSDWQPRIHPDDLPVIDREFEAARCRNGIYSAHFRAVRPDGSICDIVGVGRTAANERTRFVGLNFDLATSVGTALQEPRRPGATMSRLTTFLRGCSKAANENKRVRSSSLDRGAQQANASVDFRRQFLLGRALAAIEMRRLRQKYLNPAMLGEPPFDMLLQLYATNASPAILRLSVLSSLTGVPESTAKRWLNFLVNEGLALRAAGCLSEPGSIQVALTDKGRFVLDEYFTALNLARF